MRRCRLLLGSVVLFSIASNSAPAQTWGKYGVTVFQAPIIVPPPYVLSGFFASAYGPTNAGLVGGSQYQPLNNVNFPVLFGPSSGVTPAIGTLSGSTIQLRGINNVGQITGLVTSTSGNPNISHAFLASVGANSVTDLGTLGGLVSDATDINDNGDVVGFSQMAGANDPSDHVGHAFIYSNGIMHDLGTAGGLYSGLYSVNNAGQASGFVGTANGETHAALYSGNVLSDIGTLGGSTSYGTAINGNGTVVGYSSTNTGISAFAYTGGVMQGLGMFTGSRSFALSVSDAGFIVGNGMLVGDQTSKAALWEQTGIGYAIYDLDNIVNDGVVNNGWSFTAAFGISDDSRYITAYGTKGNESGWVVLRQNDAPGTTPDPVTTPEPGTLTLLFFGVICVVVVGRRFTGELKRV